MSISELYDFIFDENIDLQVIGNISCDDETIKWEYDGLGNTDGDMEAHLEDICDTDKTTIEDFLSDNCIQDYFFIHEAEIAESFITFQITEE